jgi:hypothetical protein
VGQEEDARAVGTAETEPHRWLRLFSRPYGTGIPWPVDPALKRRATIKRPSGTRIRFSDDKELAIRSRVSVSLRPLRIPWRTLRFKILFFHMAAEIKVFNRKGRQGIRKG